MHMILLPVIHLVALLVKGTIHVFIIELAAYQQYRIILK